jgi:hypothetical protein
MSLTKLSASLLLLFVVSSLGAVNNTRITDSNHDSHSTDSHVTDSNHNSYSNRKNETFRDGKGMKIFKLKVRILKRPFKF